MPFLLFPMLMGSFTVGMNLLTTIQVKDVVRDAANMYIHGSDFSTYGSQRVVQRLAKGLNFQMPTFSSGTQLQSNTAAAGNGVIIVTTKKGK